MSIYFSVRVSEQISVEIIMKRTAISATLTIIGVTSHNPERGTWCRWLEKRYRQRRMKKHSASHKIYLLCPTVYNILIKWLPFVCTQLPSIWTCFLLSEDLKLHIMSCIYRESRSSTNTNTGSDAVENDDVENTTLHPKVLMILTTKLSLKGKLRSIISWSYRVFYPPTIGYQKMRHAFKLSNFIMDITSFGHCHADYHLTRSHLLCFDSVRAKSDLTKEIILRTKAYQQCEVFIKSYSATRALHCYTCDSFLYRILNQALRTKDLRGLLAFRMVILDLEQQIAVLHEQQYSMLKNSFTVFRGQGMSIDELQTIRDQIGGLYLIENVLFNDSVFGACYPIRWEPSGATSSRTLSSLSNCR